MVSEKENASSKERRVYIRTETSVSMTLHVKHDGKTEVRVFDYVDDGVPVLESMFRKRLRGYKAMGYEVRPDTASLGQEQDRGQTE